MNTLQKQILLGFIALVLGVVSWWFLKYVFYIGNLTATCWVLGIVLLIFWGIALCLTMLLINNKRILYGSFLLTLIAFAMFFNNEPFYYLIGLIILFTAFWFAIFKVRQEEKVEVNLNFWRIWKRGFPFFVTALILVIALIYYFSPSLTEMRQREIKIPRPAFDFVVETIAPLIEKRLPQGIDSLDVEVNRILDLQQIEELEQQYGIEINEGETAKDFLYKLVQFQINVSSAPYQKYIPIGLAVALFLILRAIATLYIALVIILSWVFLKLLVLLRFIKVEIETKEVETVKL
jgi:hypothetical protein